MYGLNLYADSTEDGIKSESSLFSNMQNKAEKRSYSQDEIKNIKSLNIPDHKQLKRNEPELTFSISHYSIDSLKIIRNEIKRCLEDLKLDYVLGITKKNWFNFICSNISEINIERDSSNYVMAYYGGGVVAVNASKLFTIKSRDLDPDIYIAMVLVHEAGHNYYHKFLERKITFPNSVPWIYYFTSVILDNYFADILEGRLKRYQEML